MKEIKQLSDLQEFENKVVAFKKYNKNTPKFLFGASRTSVFDFAIIYSHASYDYKTNSIEIGYTMNFFCKGHGERASYSYLMNNEDAAALSCEMRLANREELTDIQDKITITRSAFMAPKGAIGTYWHFGLVAADDALGKIGSMLKNTTPIYQDRSPSLSEVSLEKKLHSEAMSWCGGIGFGSSKL